MTYFSIGGDNVEKKVSAFKMFSIYEDKLDEEIVVDAQNENIRAQEYLINKYQSFVKAKAKSYFLIGADKEDKG